MAYATKQSSAVDLRVIDAEELFQQKGPKLLEQERNGRKVATAKVPYVKYTLIFACVFATLIWVVASYMHVTELTTQNADLRASIANLEGEENALNAKKEEMYNLAFVEDYAKNVLGMVKLDKSEIQYVELSNPERMLMAEKEEYSSAFIAQLAKSFNIVLEYLN